MGTEKRERQRAARQAKTTAESEAEKRQRTKRTVVKVVGGAAAVLLALFLWSTLAGGDDDSPDTETAETTETTAPAEDEAYSNPELAAEVLARGAPEPAPPPADLAADALDVETLIEGEGDGAAEGDTVVAHYLGLIADGTVFDQSWERGETIDVTLGQGTVIEGWDEGLVGAKIGERRRLDIGSEKAYGEQGAGEVIPPDAPLAFVVDIVDIQRAQ